MNICHGGLPGAALLCAALLLPSCAPAAEETPVIRLLGDRIESSAEGVTIDGTTATITLAGEYAVSGELSEGQLRVETDKESKVTLILDGVTLRNAQLPCIYVSSADRLTVRLAEGSENTLQSGEAAAAAFDASAEGAALQAKDDLRIEGDGSLTVLGYVNNGVQTSNDLLVSGGTLTIEAVANGLKGKDSVTVSGGSLAIVSQGDGVETEGPLTVTGGTLDIRTGGGHTEVQAVSARGGRGGWTDFDDGDSGVSAKGLKSDTSILISGGAITVDALDDAVHANEAVEISGGALTLSSGDDAVHADRALTVSGGQIDVLYSYEGLEAAAVLVSGGEIALVAADDGVNASGGSASFSRSRGASAVSADGDTPLVRITGGTLTVLAGSDGIDANGSVSIEGGTTIVCGQNGMNEGALDYDLSASLTGGVLLAIGGAGGGFTDASTTQCCFAASFPQAAAAGSAFRVTDAAGTELFSCELPRETTSFLFTCPALAVGETYTASADAQSVSVTQTGLSAGAMSSGGRGGKGGRRAAPPSGG